MKIDLVLSNDWELRGDGSGDMRRVQFQSLLVLAELYESYGLRLTVTAEVLQQIAHRREGAVHPELNELADLWEKCVLETYSKGHDFQLHIHPQWSQARRVNDRWVLGDNWSIANYPPEEIRSLLSQGKSILENLIRRVDPSYQTVAFRSGSWCIAPDPVTLRTLAGLGILLDISLVSGLHYDLARVQLDYRPLEEPFLPFFPDLDDARKVSPTPQPIVCIPTFSFSYGGATKMAYSLMNRVFKKMSPSAHQAFFSPASESVVKTSSDNADYSAQYWTSAKKVPVNRRLLPQSEFRIADLALLNVAEMRIMLREIKLRARRTGWDRVPVILENHPKDIENMEPLKKFCEMISADPLLNVITALNG